MTEKSALFSLYDDVDPPTSRESATSLHLCSQNKDKGCHSRGRQRG